MQASRKDRHSKARQGRLSLGVARCALILSLTSLIGGATAAQEPPLPCASEQRDDGRLVVRQCDPEEPVLYGASRARKFIEEHAERLGLDLDQSDLQLSEDRRGLGGAHTSFRQTIGGIPVYEGLVSINLKRDGSIQSLYSTYQQLRTGAEKPELSAAEAEAIAWTGADVQSVRLPTKSELVWFPREDGTAELAWNLMVYAREPLGDFLSVIDAQDGSLLFQENRIAFVSGTGLIYQPSPMQTSGNTALVDNNGESSPELDAERVLVTLQGLDSDTGVLRGEYADLVSLPGGKEFPHADEPTRDYLYDRADPRFEQVVIYHTIDSLQRYIHSLGFDDANDIPNGIRDFPTLAHAHWYDEENSFYSTGDDALHFGDTAVDDGEDADIIVHEYGHAIQHDQNACWGGGEMRAMGEGFSDYLAASFNENFGDPTYQSLHAACIAEWDGSAFRNVDPPCLRRVDGNKIYPRDKVNQVHADGEMWSRALWDIRSLVGGVTADQMILEHHFHLPCNATMIDAAHELVATDLSLNGGANEVAIRRAFCDRGILTGTDCTTPSRLTLGMSVSPNPVRAGQIATYRLDATNVSGEPLTNLVFAATVPTDTEYLDATANHAGAFELGSVLWPALTLAAGESIALTFEVTVDPALVNTTIFEDDMESGPGNFVVSHGQGTADWTLGTANNHSGDPEQPDAPGHAWFASNPSDLTDQYLSLAADVAIAPGSQLRFWHDFTTERSFDGGRVEFSQNQGTSWFGTTAAQIVQTPYNARIHATAESPIANLEAFSGSSGGYVESIVDLDDYAGSNLRIRFRMTSDNMGEGHGWYVDDLHIGTRYHLSNAATVRGSAIQEAQIVADVLPSDNGTPTATPQTITAVQGVPTTLTLTGSDPDGEALTYSVGTPMHGTVSGTPPDVVYRSHPDYSGADTFSFRARDGSALSPPALVSITVLPDSDLDGHEDSVDNCPAIANPGQEDADGDLQGDPCDDDRDGDGTPNTLDPFPTDAAASRDYDGDGQPDELFGPSTTGLVEDQDDDQDGLPDTADQDPLDAANCRTRNPRILLLWGPDAALMRDPAVVYETPFGIDLQLAPLGEPIYVRNLVARLPLHNGTSPVFQAEVRSEAQAIFDRLTVSLPPLGSAFSIETHAVGTPVPAQTLGSPDVIYLVDRTAASRDVDGDGQDDLGNIDGFTWTGVDRFNGRCEGGRAAVFVDGSETARQVAEKIAHEAGHLFGLRNVFPVSAHSEAQPSLDDFKQASCRTPGDFQPSPVTIMDSAFDGPAAAAFIQCDAPGCTVAEPPDCRANHTGQSHNPRYHLLRYGLGYEASTLAANGVTGGDWDDDTSGGATQILRVEFDFSPAGDTPCDSLIHDVALHATCGFDEGETQVWPAGPGDESIARQMPMCEAERLVALAPESCSLRLTGASAPEAPRDLVLVQVPTANWQAEDLATQPVGTVVTLPRLGMGAPSVHTMLVRIESDGPGGPVVSPAFPGAAPAPPSLEPRYELQPDGVLCGALSSEPCGSAGEIAPGGTVTSAFTHASPPPAVAYLPQALVTSFPERADSDGDSVSDLWDNCPSVSNPSQTDTDRDGHGNRCDSDFDQNGLVGGSDFSSFYRTYGSTLGSPDFSKVADCNDDGHIGGPDFGCFINSWNRQ